MSESKENNDEHGDDFYGMSISSLASSLSNRKQMPKAITITGIRLGNVTMRKQQVSHPDCRPCAACSWCGCGKNEKDNSTICPVCTALSENGWSSYRNTSDQMFMSHNGEAVRNVKNFILASTAFVAKAMNAMSEKDRLYLINQYEKDPGEASVVANSKTTTSSTTKTQHPQKKRAKSVANVAQSKETKTKISSETNKRRKKKESIAERSPSRKMKYSVIELPTISKLLTQDRGLEGVLKADVHSVYNIYFGADANIAAKILTTLAKGDIPAEVQNETPLIRSTDALQEFSNYGSDTPPSQFVGVFRDRGEQNSYAVAIPAFPCTTPKEATIGGHLCLLSVGIKDEKTAGQLFAYMFRILYGTTALLEASKLASTPRNSIACVTKQDTTAHKPEPEQPKVEMESEC